MCICNIIFTCVQEGMSLYIYVVAYAVEYWYCLRFQACVMQYHIPDDGEDADDDKDDDADDDDDDDDDGDEEYDDAVDDDDHEDNADDDEDGDDADDDDYGDKVCATGCCNEKASAISLRCRCTLRTM